MSYDAHKSLNNAKTLLDASNVHDVVSLRVESDPRVCCCSDCWPAVWDEVNALIHPQGPVEHEGLALVRIGNEKIIVEQHESGPEVVLLITASVNLIAALINLIVVIFHSLREERKPGASIKIIKRRLVRKQISEELLLELHLNDTKISQNKAKDMIKAAVEKTFDSRD
jgi:hypothetical protein